MTAEQWGDYIVGQLNIPDIEQREWLKRQVLCVAEDERRRVKRTVRKMRAVLEKIAKRRPCVNEAWRAFYRSRQDAQDVLHELKEVSK